MKLINLLQKKITLMKIVKNKNQFYIDMFFMF